MGSTTALGGAVPVGPSPGATGSSSILRTQAFSKNASLVAVAAAKAPAIGRSATKNPAVEVVQGALFSLGHVTGIAGIDGVFGPKTETAVRAFQGTFTSSPSGKIDAATVSALDGAMASQIARLKAASVGTGQKKSRYKLVVDISNAARNRLYVVDSAGAPVACYLTSPGKGQYATKGDKFTIRRVLPRAPWNPPASSWAAGLSQVPAGLRNPMGILKLDMGAYTQYIHGIPPSADADLGKPASHGCLRVSGSNILELHELYAEAGSSVTVNRSASVGNQLAAAARSAGLNDRPIDAGREHLFGYVSGELGKYQSV